jgi:hypothetical protein
MEDIIEEYKNFATQKIQMIDSVKLLTKQLVDKLEDIQLPKLKKLFIKTGTIENDNDFKCTICNAWAGKSKASLGAHIRSCKLNIKCKEITIDSIDEVSVPVQNVVIETSQINLSETTDKNKKIKKTK